MSKEIPTANFINTSKVLNLLNNWGISSEEIIQLLALKGHLKPRQLARYRENKALPDVGSVYEHIEHLLGIADALRTMYPHNEQIGTIWINKTHRRFYNRTPMQTMLEDGLQGILYVRCHIDCAFDWQQDAKRHEK